MPEEVKLPSAKAKGLPREVEDIFSELPPDFRATLPEEDLRRLTPDTARELVDSLKASFVRPEEEQHLPVLEKICEAVHVVPIKRSRIADAGHLIRSYLTTRPFLIERDDLPGMQSMVNTLVKEQDFDFIHADQLTMVQFGIRAAAIAPSNKPKVIFDAHNAVWSIVERMQENSRWFLKPVLGVETRRIKRYEGELLKTVDHVLAVTDVDRAGLEGAWNFSKTKPGDRIAPITIVPIAVDTRQLQPIQRKPASKNIVTLGTLHYPPNADENSLRSLLKSSR